MKIKLLRDTIVRGHGVVPTGKKVEVNRATALQLINAGKAEALKGGGKETAESKTGETAEAVHPLVAKAMELTGKNAKQLAAMSDKDLLKVKGISGGTLKVIRAQFGAEE